MYSPLRPARAANIASGHLHPLPVLRFRRCASGDAFPAGALRNGAGRAEASLSSRTHHRRDRTVAGRRPAACQIRRVN